MKNFSLAINLCLAAVSLNSSVSFGQEIPKDVPCDKIEPQIVTDTVRWDTDDPAIWVNPKNREESLIIGTDKNTDGALYAFNMKGEIIKRAGGIRRPNNVDVAYGFEMNGHSVDIAVVTEREEQRLRIFSLPNLQVLDAGNLTVFDGDKTGYILVSDQQANKFQIFSREGTTANPHEHVLLKIIKVPAEKSDGSDVVNLSLPGFPSGIFVAMSQGKTFHYYSWEDIAGRDLKKHNSRQK